MSDATSDPQSDPRRALISVSNKEGVVEFARSLAGLGFEIVSTGGTLKTLQSAGIAARSVSDLTGVPEILGGRVKTLHPAIFGGILARREMSEDLSTLRDLGIGQIDVVAVNLYPFEQTAARPGAADHEIIEQIDIGGPSLLRAAAKNCQHLYPLVDPADYQEALGVLSDGREADARAFRRRLAMKVFEHCSSYDRAIAAYLARDCGPASLPDAQAEREPRERDPLPEHMNIGWPVKQRLRYGENPHQAAAFYADPGAPPPNLARCEQLQGKELSYNNYLDGDAALEMAREFENPAAVIVKHANPCGVGRGKTIKEAYLNALKCDPVSAFGGIVGFNRAVDRETAEAMAELFLEVVIAPKFEPEAREAFAKKKNLRLLEAGPFAPRAPGIVVRSVSGGLLAQEADLAEVPQDRIKIVSKAQPEAADWEGMLFAWRVVRWVKSNAIVLATRERTIGIGAGQMSRVDAARIAIEKAQTAGGAGPPDPAAVKGAYLGSDAFFPFRDVVDLAARAGIRGMIQPGGSVRDEESIQAADEHGMILAFTGQRRFRH